MDCRTFSQNPCTRGKSHHHHHFHFHLMSYSPTSKLTTHLPIQLKFVWPLKQGKKEEGKYKQTFILHGVAYILPSFSVDNFQMTIEKSPYLYSTAWQLAEKDMWTVTHKTEENVAEGQWRTSTQNNPDNVCVLTTKLQTTE